MPEKQGQINFMFDNGRIPMFTGIETVNCPNCHYRIPIKPEYADYRVLYESQHKLCEEMERGFQDYLNEIADEVPEAKIYMHNKRVKLMNMLHELIEAFKNDRPQIF
jgi:hypothetical protein